VAPRASSNSLCIAAFQVLPRPLGLRNDLLKNFLSMLRTESQHNYNMQAYRWFAAFYNTAHAQIVRPRARAPALGKAAADKRLRPFFRSVRKVLAEMVRTHRKASA
jgi:hypothetical protein